MKNLLEFILNHIVDHPEDVKVEESEGERGLVYTIHVNQEDMGKVIGKSGRIIQSIRNIAKVRAVKEHIHAQIILADDERDAQEANATPNTSTEENTPAVETLETTETESIEVADDLNIEDDTAEK